jgi:hypothetical protein
MVAEVGLGKKVERRVRWPSRQFSQDYSTTVRFMVEVCSQFSPARRIRRKPERTGPMLRESAGRQFSR